MEYPHIETNNERFTPITVSDIMKRREFQSNFSWAVPSPDAIQAIVDFALSDTIYEIGAGKGYWASFIHELGGKIKCFDNPDSVFNYFKSPRCNDRGQNIADISEFQTFYPVDFCTTMEVLEKCQKAKVLMFCWPEYDKDWAYEYLRNINPEKMIYVGEGYGGCCANDDFFNYIEGNYNEYKSVSIPQWNGIYDSLILYNRKDKK